MYTLSLDLFVMAQVLSVPLSSCCALELVKTSAHLLAVKSQYEVSTQCNSVEWMHAQTIGTCETCDSQKSTLPQLPCESSQSELCDPPAFESCQSSETRCACMLPAQSCKVDYENGLWEPGYFDCREGPYIKPVIAMLPVLPLEASVLKLGAT
jgi:hypothetical protein